MKIKLLRKKKEKKCWNYAKKTTQGKEKAPWLNGPQTEVIRTKAELGEGKSGKKKGKEGKDGRLEVDEKKKCALQNLGAKKNDMSEEGYRSHLRGDGGEIIWEGAKRENLKRGGGWC